jgi:hypothetical protein
MRAQVELNLKARQEIIQNHVGHSEKVSLKHYQAETRDRLDDLLQDLMPDI